MIFNKLEKRMSYKELDSYTWNSLNTLSVTNEDLLKEETYMRCISYIANKMSTIPIKIMKTTPKGNIEFTQHKLYNILKNKPNQYQNSVDLIKALYNSRYFFLKADVLLIEQMIHYIFVKLIDFY